MISDTSSASRSFSTTKVLLLGLFSILPTWAIGISALWFHFIALTAFVIAKRYNRSLASVNPVTLFLALYVIWYALSILINSPHNEFVRTTAAIYNWSFWLMGLLTCTAASTLNWRTWLNLLEKPFTLAAVFLAVTSILAIFSWYKLGIEALEVRTLLGTVIDTSKLPPLLAHSSTMVVFGPDYINGNFTPRLSALAPYPTATAALAVFLAPFVIFRKPSGILDRIIWLLAVIGIVATLYLALSRTIIVGALIAAIVTILVYKRAFLVVALLSVPLIALITISSTEFMDTILNSRGGSTQLRADLYFFQTSLVLNESPFFGLGVKDRLSQFEIPLGSHSTFLGALYKTGIVGFLLIIALIISINTLWVRAIHRATDKDVAIFASRLGFSILTISLWTLTEDIDAPALVCFLFFLFAGLLAAITKEQQTSR